MSKAKKQDWLISIPATSQEVRVYCAHQELVDPKTLVAHPDNNNTHTEHQVEMMQSMIGANGWRSVVVVSKKSGKIVAGHLRVQAAIAMGMEQVPVDFQYFKDRAAEVKHLTADNELAKLSEFDANKFAMTAKELESELSADEFQDFIFDASHFGLEEIPELEGEQDDDPQADVVPVVKNPITRKGDIWVMKTHRLMCGDSGSAKNISDLFKKEKASLMFTDPPYRMDTAGGGFDQSVGQSVKKTMDRIKHLCDFDPVQFLATFPSVFSKGVMNAYVFCNKDLVPDYLNWAIEKGYSFNILFWKKPNAVPMGGSHRPDVEYLLLFRKGATWNNGVPGVNYSKCLEFNRETSEAHPTMKPVGLIVNELMISSNESDIVFEPFSGSGSTLIACEKTGRICYGIELDETYCDVAVQRWMDYTGEEAHLYGSGEMWSEVMATRRAENGTTTNSIGP